MGQVSLKTGHSAGTISLASKAYTKSYSVIPGMLASILFLKFIILLWLYWGYTVTFTKVLTIYHSRHHSLLSPSPPIPGMAFILKEMAAV
jgi:hypothetical protein